MIKNGKEVLDMISHGYYPAANGCSEYKVECPFCHSVQMVRAWSIAGSGKRCECGAMLTNMMAYKELKP